MKQKKIVIIMAGILAAAAAMTGCAEQNKTATQVDYTQNAQGKSEQTKQKTAEKSQPDKKQVNKSAKKAAVFRRLIEEYNINEQDLNRIISPIGLEIKAETPAEIAISITGQMIQVRADRKDTSK